MNEVFADTSAFVSFLNARDEHHDAAAEQIETCPGKIVTTWLVLVELGNYLSGTADRRLFAPFVRELRNDKRFEILAADTRLIDGGLLEYSRRPDQKWSFTDCTSFFVMRRRKIAEALTSDHHFTQAGFIALLT